MSRKLVIAMLFLGTAGGLWFLFSSRERPETTQAVSKEASSTPPSESPERASEMKGGYVGSQQCVGCHRAQFDSYRRTSHSKSMSEVDPAQEAENQWFLHALSGRNYEVSRRGDRLYHTERMGQEQDGRVLHDLPIRFVMGSGHFGKSYLAERDGFLLQSPITWYTTRDSWGMSPGYDATIHRSFQRTVSTGCLFCHSGVFESVDENPHRITVHEPAIGCERCHGPGALHVERQSLPSVSEVLAGEIVHPGELPRREKEAVCEQCHLQGDASVLRLGKELSEFRPGQPLEHIRLDFHQKREKSQMTIVGHTEQLRLSACYQKSDTLSCIVCHNPHRPIPENETVAVYRKVCLTCHDTGASERESECRLSLDERQRRAENDCVQCHMPQAPTEIPHVAFTHHRIGIHASETPEQGEVIAGEIDSAQDLSELSETEALRSQGLAQLEVFRRHGDEANRAQAVRLLTDFVQSGIRDPVSDAALAKLLLESGEFARAEQLASRALEQLEQPIDARIEALDVLGAIRFRTNRFEAAREILRELTAHRREAQHWFFLGLTEQNLDNSEAAIAALHKSIEIDPAQSGAYGALATILDSLGRRTEAESVRSLQPQ